MKKVFIGILTIGVFSLFLLPICAVAQDKTSVKPGDAVILFLKGDVKIKTQGAAVWRNADKDIKLSSGASVKTGKDSWAEIGLGEDYMNVVKVKEMTEVEIASFGPANINLLNGELRCLVEKLDKGSTFEVTTPTAVCGARGTGWDTATDGKGVIVDTYEHEVYFTPLTKGAVDPVIPQGKRGMMRDPSKPVEISDVPLDKLIEWNWWKYDYFERRGLDKTGAKKKVKKTSAGHRTIEGLMKGKDSAAGKKDRDSIKGRTENKKSDGGGYCEGQ